MQELNLNFEETEEYIDNDYINEFQTFLKNFNKKKYNNLNNAVLKILEIIDKYSETETETICLLQMLEDNLFLGKRRNKKDTDYIG